MIETFNTHIFNANLIGYLEFIFRELQKRVFFRYCFYPPGKPIALHLLCCQGFAVDNYSFTLGASKLQYSRLLQHWGLYLIGYLTASNLNPQSSNQPNQPIAPQIP